MRLQTVCLRFLLMVLLATGFFSCHALAAGSPLTITDSLGRQLTLTSPPQRVVCLLSSVTDLLVALDRTELLVGLTRQDLLNHSALQVKSIGGFFDPDLPAITAVRPDLIIAATSHRSLLQQWLDDPQQQTTVLFFREGSLEDGFARMAAIGALVDRKQQAQVIIDRNREQIALVQSRLKELSPEQRKRVARVAAGPEKLFCPGDDSFQNEMIRAAGGTPPHWEKDGGFFSVDVTAWQTFNPQIIYGCNSNMEAVQAILSRKGFKEVEAVRNRAIHQLPCSVACQVTPHVGAAVQWLAASFHPELMADTGKAVSSNTLRGEHPLTVALPYVASAHVLSHRVNDADFKSLVIRFTTPQVILSTAEENRGPVQAVGNTFIPMHASLGHMQFGVEQVRRDVAANLGYNRKTYAGMMTGADMDNLSVQVQREDGLEAVALVTAGVRGNAQRLSRDIGYSYPSGTINILLLTNRRLTAAAMAQAIITATEAKTAALLDLDIRSTALPRLYRATGTGTDSMIVVQGEGPPVSYTGGHGKIGELIARAVHAGVTEALIGQNGIRAGRDVLQRLHERNLSLEQLAQLYPSPLSEQQLVRRLELALADPLIAGFVETALLISDEEENGLISDLQSFDLLCVSMGERLSGRKNLIPTTISIPDALPSVMARAFGVLVAGVNASTEKTVGENISDRQTYSKDTPRGFLSATSNSMILNQGADQ